MGSEMCIRDRLCISKETAPGEIQEFHYVLTWNVPNCSNYWSGLDISTSNIHYDVCDRTPWKYTSTAGLPYRNRKLNGRECYTVYFPVNTVCH